jgi:hypothetical protein
MQTPLTAAPNPLGCEPAILARTRAWASGGRLPPRGVPGSCATTLELGTDNVPTSTAGTAAQYVTNAIDAPRPKPSIAPAV